MMENKENKDTPFNKEFCTLLEFRLCEAFVEFPDAQLRLFWCDGVSWTPTENQLTKKHVNDKRKIITEARIGKNGQDLYQAIIHFGKKSLSNYAKGIELTECIPALDSETDWIKIDIRERTIDIKLK